MLGNFVLESESEVELPSRWRWSEESEESEGWSGVERIKQHKLVEQEKYKESCKEDCLCKVAIYRDNVLEEDFLFHMEDGEEALMDRDYELFVQRKLEKLVEDDEDANYEWYEEVWEASDGVHLVHSGGFSSKANHEEGYCVALLEFLSIHDLESLPCYHLHENTFFHLPWVQIKEGTFLVGILYDKYPLIYLILYSMKYKIRWVYIEVFANCIKLCHLDECHWVASFDPFLYLGNFIFTDKWNNCYQGVSWEYLWYFLIFSFK